MVKSDQEYGKAQLPVKNHFVYRNVEETINRDCKEKRRMKTPGFIIFIAAALCLAACGADKNNDEVISSDAALEITTDSITKKVTVLDDTVYIGEYLDRNVEEPNLEIAKDNDGEYIVQIGIYRLTSLEDGIGKLTADGLLFSATDAAGEPISGIITSDGQTATVTFTDSTWENLPNDSSFQYTKVSDIPNL